MSPTAAIVGAVGVVVAGIIAYLTARVTNKSSPYKDIGDRLDRAYDRMDKLTERVRELEAGRRDDRDRMDQFAKDQDALVGALVEQEDWAVSGAEGERPPFVARVLVLMLRHRAERAAAAEV